MIQMLQIQNLRSARSLWDNQTPFQMHVLYCRAIFTSLVRVHDETKGHTLAKLLIFDAVAELSEPNPAIIVIDADLELRRCK